MDACIRKVAAIPGNPNGWLRTPAGSLGQCQQRLAPQWVLARDTVTTVLLKNRALQQVSPQKEVQNTCEKNKQNNWVIVGKDKRRKEIAALEYGVIQGLTSDKMNTRKRRAKSTNEPISLLPTLVCTALRIGQSWTQGQKASVPEGKPVWQDRTRSPNRTGIPVQKGFSKIAFKQHESSTHPSLLGIAVFRQVDIISC